MVRRMTNAGAVTGVFAALLACTPASHAEERGDGAATAPKGTAAEAPSRAVSDALAVERTLLVSPSLKLYFGTKPGSYYKHLAAQNERGVFLSKPLAPSQRPIKVNNPMCGDGVQVKPNGQGSCRASAEWDASTASVRYSYDYFIDTTKQSLSMAFESYVFNLELNAGSFRAKDRLKTIRHTIEGVDNVLEERIEFGTVGYALRQWTAPTAKPGGRTNKPRYFVDTRGKLFVANRKMEEKDAFSGFRLVQGKKSWSSEADLSATAQARWDEKGLELFVRVRDDRVVLGEGLDKDHLEIWFNNGEEVVKKLRRDDGLQLVISMVDSQVILTTGFPSSTAEGRRILAGSYRLVDGGYEVRFELAKDDFKWVERMSEGIWCFTLAISDTDEAAKPRKVIASSELKSADPATFGRLLLKKDYGLPEMGLALIDDDI